jgi:integrase
MAPNKRLTDAVVRALGVDPVAAASGNDTFAWDGSLAGFGVKITPSGTKSFVYAYRHDGRKRRLTLGRADKMSTSKARALAEVAQTAVRAGRDPQAEKAQARAAQTVKDHAQEWLASLRAKAKRDELSERTVLDYASKVNLHIVPAFGRMKPADLTTAAIKSWRASKLAEADKADGTRRLGVEGVKGTLRVLSALCSYLKDEAGVIASNPAKGLGQFTTRQVERYLTQEETARLSAVLERWRERGPLWVSVIELALLTGMRKGEILKLRWDAVDEVQRRILLRDHKTKRTSGAKTLHLGEAALEVLEKAKAWRRLGNPYVFPSQEHRNVALVKSGQAPSIDNLRGCASAGGLKRAWHAIRAEAGLKEGEARCRIHDLRHNFGAVGASSGIPLTILGKSMGHRNVQTTARYAHIYDEAAAAATRQNSALVKERLSKKPTEAVIQFPWTKQAKPT